MIDLVVPPTVAQCHKRISTLLFTLALLVFFVFPTSAQAGTEVVLDRYLLGGLLVAGGIALRVLPAHGFLILALHGGLQFFFGATWAVAFSGAAVAYAALSLMRMQRGGGARVATADTTDEERTLHPADIMRENVESIAMALLIALACREFLYEAFLIPTASMEPTILGKNAREGRDHGDRLLATKVGMMLRDPPRWSIVVFKYPLFRRVNYIKRLVGLPGERVELRSGDVYVNGECVAKPEVVQDQLWFAEYPLSGQPTPLSQALTRDDRNAEWTLGADTVSVDVPEGVESRLFYDETLSRTDSDLSVGVRVDPSEIYGDGAVLLRVEGAERRVELAINRFEARLTAPGIDGEILPDVALPDGSCRVALGVADRVVRVWIDGRLVARVPHVDDPNGGEPMPRVSFGVTGGKASFSELRVHRDLQYTRSRAWDIPDDGFIMLGDNTLSSKDSREWTVNVVTTADGRVYEGEDMVKLEDESIVRFRTVDGFHEFIDVDGVFRRIPTEGAEVESGIPRPYVRRRDLVGRAFVTFFPFPPFGSTRIHFLP